jgi:hypothetical protein
MSSGDIIPFWCTGTEQKTVVHYETLEERRAAMIAKGWAPAAVAALEEAMEPMRDMREEEERENMKVVEEAGDGETEH